MCNGLAELIGVEVPIGRMLEVSVNQRIEVVERLFRRAVRQGEIAALDDGGDAARTFVAFLTGLNTLSKVVRDERRLWAMCR